MNAREYIGFGFLFTLYNGISQFVFNYEMNAFGMSLGIMIFGMFALIYENYIKEKRIKLMEE